MDRAEAGPAWARVLAFLAICLALQAMVQAALTLPAARALMEAATVVPAAVVLAWWRPDDGLVALAGQWLWPGGRMRVLAGCDGLEVILPFTAAVLVGPLAWRRRALWLPAGVALLWLLNQGRIVVLYLALRHWRAGFDALHLVWGPIVLLGAAMGLFAWTLRRPA